MKVVSLEYSQRELFAGMDPFDSLKNTALPGWFALVSARESGEEDIPCGLLVAELTQARLFIHWLLVLPEERQKGAGEALLNEAIRIAAEAGCHLITVLISKGSEWNGVCMGADRYLSEMGFEPDKQMNRQNKSAWAMTTSADNYRKEKNKWKELPYSKQLELLTKEGLLEKEGLFTEEE
ncbi:MAG: GNAT family N-acetyltransferase [Lachnospiraceae bacterium]|nr:GNAT family N-acetyltransferase [Lachnospiraceae bacterium]